MLSRLRTLLRITHSQGIMRRYFVVNGFDGALTMMGLCMGFYISDQVQIAVVIHACLGAAIALGMSGLSSAYISEAAEKKKEAHKNQLRHKKLQTHLLEGIKKQGFDEVVEHSAVVQHCNSLILRQRLY